MNKKVLDVTEWQHSHPGSPAPLQAFGGKDATSAFKNRGHSENAKKLMKEIYNRKSLKKIFYFTNIYVPYKCV